MTAAELGACKNYGLKKLAHNQAPMRMFLEILLKFLQTQKW